MRKRIISVMLCLLMLLALAPMAAFAEAGTVQNIVWNGDNGLTFKAVDGAVYYTLELWDSSRCWIQRTFLPGSSDYTVTNGTVSFGPAIMKSMHQTLTKDSSCYMLVSAENGSHATIAQGKSATRSLTAYPAMGEPQNVKWSGPFATWDAVSGVSNYTLWLYEVEANGSIKLGHIYKNTVTTTKVSLASYLEGGKTYRFMVQSEPSDATHRSSGSVRSGDVTALDTIAVVGLTKPEIGASAAKNAASIKAAPDSLFKVIAANWIDDTTGNAMTGNAVFEKGHEYILRVYTEPLDGYVFASTANMTGTVDGKAAYEINSVYQSDTQRTIRYRYGAPEKLTVTSVDVSGYVLPVVGAKAGDCLNLSVSENCHLDMSKCYWYCNSTGTTLSANDVFEAGKRYSLLIYVCADENCRFAGDTAITVNGSTEYVDSEHIGLGDIIVPFWTKQVTAASEITDVEACGYEPAVVGDKAGDHMNLYAYGNYSIDMESCYWYCDTDGKKLAENDVFEAGKEYSLLIYLIPNGTNKFAYEVDYAVNGGTEYVDFGSSQNTTECVELWTTPMEAIPSVATVRIYGYEPAVAGDMAADHMDVLVEGKCSIDWENSYWYCDTTGQALNTSEVFREGYEYSLFLSVIPDEGYVFAYEPDCTLNGSTAYVDIENCQRTPDCFEVWTVPMAAEVALTEITSVAISGYQVPSVGDKAGDNLKRLTVPAGANYKITQCEWHKYNGEDTPDTLLADDDVFLDGNSYYIWLRIEPLEGFIFNDMSTVSCSVNGKTSLVDHSFPICGAFVVYMATTQPEKAPAVLENPFVDVPEGSVYHDAILWAYYHTPKQITGGFDATHFVPGNPCTRAQVVTFLWRAAGCPEPTGYTSIFKDSASIAAPFQKAVAWAVENGITTGYNDGTFRPNATVTRAQFVTFLYRYEKEPPTSGSIAGFADAAQIASSYQKAVAWAVEKGVTTGYAEKDGTFTFRPNATCTRWAVVLFMYRDMT